MSRDIKRQIIKAYAEESGISHINRRLSGLVKRFRDGRAQKTRDIAKIEQRRDLNMKLAAIRAKQRRAWKWYLLDHTFIPFDAWLRREAVG